MVADLEAKQTKVAVLFRGGYEAEPNESRRLGSSLLDEYLAGHYQLIGGSKEYLWLRRKPQQ